MLIVPRHLLPWCTLLLCLQAAADDGGRHWYRYYDDHHQAILSDTLDESALKHGYQILDANMNIIGDVPPPPDATELARRKQVAEQAKADARLLSLYGSSADAQRQLQNHVEALQASIDIKQGALQRATAELNQATAKAANYERAGQTVPAALLKHIGDAQQQVQALQSDIGQLQQTIQSTRDAYNKVIARLRLIEAHQATSHANSSPNSTNSE